MLKKINKTTRILLALVILLGAIPQGTFTTERVLAADSAGGKAVNVVDLIRVYDYYDRDKIYASWKASNPDNATITHENIYSAQDIWFYMEWSIKENQVVNPGDYFTIVFPDIFDHNRLSEKGETNLFNEDGSLLAIYSIYTNTAGKKELKYVFQDSVSTHEDISGTYGLHLITIIFTQDQYKDFSLNLNGTLITSGGVTGNGPGSSYYYYVDSKNSDRARTAWVYNGYYFFRWEVWLNLDFGVTDNYKFEDIIPVSSSHVFITDTTLAQLGISLPAGLVPAVYTEENIMDITVWEYIGSDNLTGGSAEDTLSLRKKQFMDRMNNVNNEWYKKYMQSYQFRNGSMTFIPDNWPLWDIENSPNIATELGIDGGTGMNRSDGMIAISADGKTMSGDLGRVTRPVVVTYYTIATEKFDESALYDAATVNGSFKNTINVNGNKSYPTYAHTVWIDQQADIQGVWGSYSFSFTKTDEAGNPLEGARFSLYTNPECTGTVYKTASSIGNGTVSFTNLKADTYYFKETYTPSDYILSNTIYKVVLTNSSDYVITNLITSDVITSIKNQRKLQGSVNISGVKTWAGDGAYGDIARPDFITVNLLRGGTVIETTTTDKERNWAYTFTDLPKYDDNQVSQTEYVYSVEEVTLDDYNSSVTDNDITNTYKHALIDVTVKKAWEDVGYEINRPATIEVSLLANGTPVEKKELKASDGWTYTWENLPPKKAGELIIYTVVEPNDPTGYAFKPGSSVSDASGDITITIINKYIAGKTSLTVNKIWDDGHNQDGKRPDSVTVRLLENGKPLERDENDAVQTLSRSTSWKYTWTNLPEYGAGGQPIVYTVEETGTLPTGYSKGQYVPSTASITNSYTPETIDVKVTKQWNDGGIVSNSHDPVMVQLYSNGTAEGLPVTLGDLEPNGWSYTWTGMPKYSHGEEIEYYVREVSASGGYLPTYIDSNPENLIIINTPGTGITVQKAWDDEEDRDGVRPNSVTVMLNAKYTDGSPAPYDGDVVQLDSYNSWTHTWSGLALYDESGIPISYRVEETSPPGDYVPNISQNGDTFTVTNSRTPYITSKTVTKQWDDDNDRDGMRPGSVTVQLLADGSSYGPPVGLTENGGWSYTWSGLPMNDGGVEIEYSVLETTPEGYTSEFKQDSFTLTNKYTPETTIKTVTKIWDDGGDKAGTRSDSVTVQLYANNQTYGQPVTLNAGNNWSYTWDDLPEKRDGAACVYTVDEVTRVPGYIASYSGDTFTVTNKLQSVEAVIDGTKVLTGRSLSQGEFSFELKRGNEALQIKSNDSNGVITFDALTFYAPGTYTYTVSEVIGGSTGIYYDPTVYTVTVEVGENSDGTLRATVNYPSGGIVFRNTYTPPDPPDEPEDLTPDPPPSPSPSPVPPPPPSPSPVPSPSPSPSPNPSSSPSPSPEPSPSPSPSLEPYPDPNESPDLIPGFVPPESPTPIPGFVPPVFAAPVTESVPPESPAPIPGFVPPLENINTAGIQTTQPVNMPAVTAPGNTLTEMEDGTFLEFDEDGIPLGAWHFDEEDGEWVFEDFNPLSNYMPKSGENSPVTAIFALGILLVLSGICLKVFNSRNRKHSR